MSQNERNYPNGSPPAYSLHQHACITLSSTDHIRLIQFPSTIIDVVRQAIEKSWSLGIQNEEVRLGAFEFKLNGNPWWGQGDEAISSRLLMSHILSALYNRGWYLLASSDVSKKQADKDTLIFQLGIPPTQASFFAISFNDYDKLRLIGAPRELIPAVHQALNPSDIQREKWLGEGIAYQFRFYGNPWVSRGEENINSSIKLLALLDCLTSSGWKLYASIDISQGHNGRATDSWFFRRDI